MTPSPYCRSRVTPGSSATIAARLRVRQLNNVDLPTFGRPTNTTTGFMGRHYAWPLGCLGAGAEASSVALYRYIGENEAPVKWGADGMVRDPLGVLGRIDAGRRMRS